MADITKCSGIDCPLKETCYRYYVKPNKYRQLYFVKPPFKNGKCDYYDKH